MKYYILLCCFSITTFAQNLTGQQLLEKAIEHHDPQGNWSQFNGNLSITMEIPNKLNRNSNVSINLPEQYFAVQSKRDSVTTKFQIKKDSCSFLIDGKLTTNTETLKKHHLSCKRAKMIQNYYTFLYGLPMKLKDKGTIIHEKTTRKVFKGKEYLVLKVTYQKEVGHDIWYFYFNPKNYAMEVYQFFHDEAKKDGEYILLTDIKTINHIKFPKNRAWYTNKDNQLLGTDILK